MTKYAIYIDGKFQHDVRDFAMKPDTPSGVDLYTIHSELQTPFDPLREKLAGEVVEDHENQTRTLRLKTEPKTDCEIFGLPEGTIQFMFEQENRLRRMSGEDALTRSEFREQFIQRQYDQA